MYKVRVDSLEIRNFRSLDEVTMFMEELQNDGLLYAVIKVVDASDKSTEYIKQVPKDVLAFLEKSDTQKGATMAEGEFKTSAGSQIDWMHILGSNGMIAKAEKEGQQSYHLTDVGQDYLNEYKRMKLRYRL